MSRIGKLPVGIEKDVQVNVSDSNVVTIKAGNSELLIPVKPEINVDVQDGAIVLTRKNDAPQTRAYHGLFRSLINNAVIGVTKGWEKQLELNGVGYKAAVKGKSLELHLGYSHPIEFNIPEGITIKVEKNTTVVVAGVDLQQVGEVAAKIRSMRPTEPYLGKGVRYVGEHIRRKAGKLAGK